MRGIKFFYRAFFIGIFVTYGRDFAEFLFTRPAANVLQGNILQKCI